MPELPEVETCRRGLAPYVEGQQILRVHLTRPNLRFPFARGFASSLNGARVVALHRRAKYLLAELEGGKADYWLSHLGMSGKFIWYPHPTSKKEICAGLKHSHVLVEFAHGILVYCDPRRFGFMELIKGDYAAHPRLAGLGVEPLTRSLTAALMYKQCADNKNNKRAIKPALLDQSLIAGLGNIYVCEALFFAGIHPARPASEVSLAEWQLLVPAIKKVLRAAIKAGGSSIQDFANIDGASGYFQHQFSVYGRDGEICFGRGGGGCGGQIATIKQAGRSGFFCPECQK